MTSDKLWSPQMRKWARDAHRHGIPIGFERKGVPHRDREWEGGVAARAPTPVPQTGGALLNLIVAGRVFLNFVTKSGSLSMNFLTDDSGANMLADDANVNQLTVG